MNTLNKVNITNTDISKEIFDILNKYGEQAIKEMITRLKNLDKIASGKLINSLKYEIRSELGGLQLYFEMIDYGMQVDQGLNGVERIVNRNSPFNTNNTPVKLSKIKEWCRYKGIPESAAKPITNSIYHLGVEPTFFYSITTKRRLPQIEKQISEAIDNSFK